MDDDLFGRFLRPHLYTLEGHKAVPTFDVHEWGRVFASQDRIVAQHQIGPVFVSTVFLGIDHNHAMHGPPLLFETMTFDHSEGKTTGLDQDMERYSTWEEAEAGHTAMLLRVNEVLALKAML